MTYTPGALAYMPLRFDRTPVCRFCGCTFASLNGTARTCPKCIGTAAHKVWRRRQQAAYAKRRRANE